MASLPEWLSAYLQPYAEVRRNGLSLADLVDRHLPASLLPRLRRVGLIVLRPDSMLNNRAAGLLEYLEAAYGIIPLMLRILYLHPQLCDALYRFKLPRWGANAWLHHELFAQAPCAVAIVAGNPPPGRTLAGWLDELKGPSLAPGGGPAAHLRPRFGRQSSFHAVVHCAEDPGAFLYESTLFFEWSALRELLRSRALVSAGPISPGPLPAALLRVLLAFDCTRDASVFELLLRTKQKILAALCMKPQRHLQTLKELSQDLHDAVDEIVGKQYLDQRCIFSRFARAERARLAALIDAQEKELSRRLARGRRSSMKPGCGERWRRMEDAMGQLALLYASWQLSGHEACEPERGPALFQLLENNDVPVSAWQRTLIQAGLAADINPDARWDGAKISAEI